MKNAEMTGVWWNRIKILTENVFYQMGIYLNFASLNPSTNYI